MIIIDFAPLYAVGVKKVYLVNLMEQDTGTGPRVKPVTLAAAFNAFNDAKTAYNGNIFYVELASLLFSIE